ncbi:MAG: hypothetical protein WKG07_22350 [Hymenobacter sp.]
MRPAAARWRRGRALPLATYPGRAHALRTGSAGGLPYPRHSGR